MENDPKQMVYERQKKRIRECLGHQPIKVIGGGLLGMKTGALSYLCTCKKWLAIALKMR
ncbi:hypothetical protein [Thermaerobacillus caldiproteolyticus]|uniref:Acid phosphatase family membrane protein YuiD n=1 Tax=Thermaerobacillus caldiproteolyticus TaxID=247480 RepID=A0A7W0C0X3_9BACL|nr:hypothetical protein [Anoxybacillus caldiproteolyticus]MBA2876416.1 acid phosphatase family membrane protein YuiD [Anoxybacillus caldiproteolyticus]